MSGKKKAVVEEKNKSCLHFLDIHTMYLKTDFAN